MKTAELTGKALDWAVAKCEGICTEAFLEDVEYYTPSSDWLEGGPIIEREALDVNCYTMNFPSCEHTWEVRDPYWEHSHISQSLLVAAMRCYVASKLGDEIDVPNELIGE